MGRMPSGSSRNRRGARSFASSPRRTRSPSLVQERAWLATGPFSVRSGAEAVFRWRSDAWSHARSLSDGLNELARDEPSIGVGDALTRAFGERLVKKLLVGPTVGEAVRNARLDLLRGRQPARPRLHTIRAPEPAPLGEPTPRSPASAVGRPPDAAGCSRALTLVRRRRSVCGGNRRRVRRAYAPGLLLRHFPLMRPGVSYREICRVVTSS